MQTLSPTAGKVARPSPTIQPFSKKSHTPTVAKEFQIGLYDPTEADLEHFWNCCSEGVLGERLYVVFFCALSVLLSVQKDCAPQDSPPRPISWACLVCSHVHGSRTSKQQATAPPRYAAASGPVVWSHSTPAHSSPAMPSVTVAHRHTHGSLSCPPPLPSTPQDAVSTLILLLSLRQKAKSSCLTKRRVSAIDWPRHRSA